MVLLATSPRRLGRAGHVELLLLYGVLAISIRMSVVLSLGALIAAMLIVRALPN
jgi:hypothetical protein